MDQIMKVYRRHGHLHHRKREAIPEPFPEPFPDEDLGLQKRTATVLNVIFVTRLSNGEFETVGTSVMDSGSVPTSGGRNAPPTQFNEEGEVITGVESAFPQPTESSDAQAGGPINSAPAPAPTSVPSNMSPTFQSNVGAQTASSGASKQNGGQSSGLSVGAYAGIVGGVVLLAFVVIAVVVMVMRRKKQKRDNSYGKPEDEKGLNRRSMMGMDHQNFNGPPSPTTPSPPMSPVSQTPKVAPRLSMRLTTLSSFMPNLGDNVNGDGQQKQTLAEKRGSSIKAPPAALTVNSEKRASPGPFDSPMDSPSMSAFSDGTGSLGAPSSNNAAQPSTVHRVMMDFQPSMADELELRAGDVVRMLHEYDDGWALCIRMDRSQQGVCPRTCLSQRPVKPRPPPGARAGPPPPGQRSPYGPPRAGSGSGSRPSSPSGSRPHTPQGPQSPRIPTKLAPARPSSPSSHRGSAAGPASPVPQTQPGRQPHPLSNVQKGSDLEFHAM